MFPSLLQAQGDWSWRELPIQPFDRLEVSFYAVDSQEQTIFVSTKGGATTTDEATFIFDRGESCWKPYYGQWAMPFNGRGLDTMTVAWMVLLGSPKTRTPSGTFTSVT
jgi:hypothetical protein